MITRIWQRLSVGSLQDAEHLATANPLGITSVLSLCPKALSMRAPAIHYVQLPVADSCAMSARQFDQIVAAIAQGIRRGKLLVHCAGGISRSPIIAAAWMHRCGYAAIDAALAEIADLRPIIDPSPVLLDSVRRLLQ